MLSQLFVVSDLEQVLSKLVGLGFADYGCVSVLSLLPERVGVCVAFPALICEYYEGAASVAAVFFEPDQTLALKGSERMPQSGAVQYEQIGELIERGRILAAIDKLGEDGELR